MKLKFTFIILLLNLIGFVNGQNFNYNAFVGLNTNFIKIKSEFQIADEIAMKPSISYNIGGSIQTNKEKLNFLGTVEFLRIENILTPKFKSNYIEDTRSKIINKNFIISIQGVYNIKKYYYIGSGISISYLINSIFRTDNVLRSYSLDDLGKRFKNIYYRPLILSIPFTMGYKFKKVDLIAVFNLGVMSKLPNDFYIKEFDNTLRVVIAYRFQSKNNKKK